MQESLPEPPRLNRGPTVKYDMHMLREVNAIEQEALDDLVALYQVQYRKSLCHLYRRLALFWKGRTIGELTSDTAMGTASSIVWRCNAGIGNGSKLKKFPRRAPPLKVAGQLAKQTRLCSCFITAGNEFPDSTNLGSGGASYILMIF